MVHAIILLSSQLNIKYTVSDLQLDDREYNNILSMRTIT